ncbi:hypothetical protein B0T10DRAFT_204847 [Thelonectria olida]|uniref:BAH domain-containing protein n=1 Tax=Thelonectria olida TaxID=1576542 RepID=A0A9P9ALF4_9HYPO|nr:hypothetical protein B0T10DRAFT_204847 [Thelonectria olida]
MSPKLLNRSHAINQDNCPFTATISASPTYEGRDTKVKCDGLDDDRKEFVQQSPFEPKGKFKTHQTMDVFYTVEPCKEWLDMTRYRSFVLNGVKYYDNDFVYITNNAPIKQRKAKNKRPKQLKSLQTADFWIARVLEIRASDEHHVFARIFWMYSPDELPACGILDGKKWVSSFQPHRIQNELIASNHMDVINVVRIAMHAQAKQWVESDGERVHNTLYWRQALDCRTSELSSVDVTEGKISASPSKALVGRTNDECQQWLHDDFALTKQINGITPRMAESLSPPTPLPTAEETSRPSSIKGCPKPEIIPYEGPLKPTLKLGADLTVLQLEDLRQNVSSGDNSSRSDNSMSPNCQALPPMPPLLPIYLPFKAQHKLLVHLQNVLEVACYNFGKRTIPDTLQRRGWDCAESVELNRWTEEFLSQQESFPDKEHISKPLDQFFRSIANIRHTAVHRHRICAKSIDQFLLDAEALAILLGDADCTRHIVELRREIQVAVEELERNKQFLRSTLGKNLEEIVVKRAELQRMEEMAIAEMKRKEEEYQILAGKRLEDAMASSVASSSTAIDTEMRFISGPDNADGTDEGCNEEGQPGDDSRHQAS